jgi:hypothetical protein
MVVVGGLKVIETLFSLRWLDLPLNLAQVGISCSETFLLSPTVRIRVVRPFREHYRIYIIININKYINL